MTRNWIQLEGVSLAGRHWLKQCLTSTPDDAWYLTRFDTTRDAAVRVLAADAPFAEEQLAVWREALAFDHPHLARMLDAGRAEAEGDDVVYAVCEYPDDVLSSVVQERPLSSDEALEVLHALRSALGFLHENGFAHGAVEPSHIMAFGDRIKLPSDTVRRSGAQAVPAEPTLYDAPEVAAGGPVTPAADMWSLGVTLREVLAPEQQNADGEAERPPLPEPFASIVRNTVKLEARERWTVGDIENHLNPPAPVLPPPPVIEPVAAVPAPPEISRVAPPVATRPEPTPIAPPRHAPREDAPVNRGFPVKWVPIAGLVAAVALSAVFLRHPDQSAPRARRAEPAGSPSRRRPRRQQQPARAPERAPAAATAPAPPRARGSAARAGSPAIWRVVVYTYSARSAAEKKVRSLNQQHPAWHAEVFAPKGEHGPFFVSLGGRMTLPEAERLQREARAKGLPRDTFVRNFTS